MGIASVLFGFLLVLLGLLVQLKIQYNYFSKIDWLPLTLMVIGGVFFAIGMVITGIWT